MPPAAPVTSTALPANGQDADHPARPYPPATVQLVIAAAGEGEVRPRLDLIVLILQNNGDER